MAEANETICALSENLAQRKRVSPPYQLQRQTSSFAPGPTIVICFSRRLTKNLVPGLSGLAHEALQTPPWHTS
eukprot:2804925-Heterocapsa_arctica.AAC.1